MSGKHAPSHPSRNRNRNTRRADADGLLSRRAPAPHKQAQHSENTRNTPQKHGARGSFFRRDADKDRDSGGANRKPSAMAQARTQAQQAAWEEAHGKYDRIPGALPQSGFDVYVAARGFLPELLEEIGDDVIAVRGRLVLARHGCAGYARGNDAALEKPLGDLRPAWAQNVWRNPQWLTITSINDAARQLRSLQRNWYVHSVDHHRRAALIQEALPAVRGRPHVFGTPLPAAPLGGWTLWDANTILASPHTASPFPDGNVPFVENKLDPPGRAYLKLWETFTLVQRFPRSGELCLDLGASPGGWTWVLGSLGARVFSLDKAPLAPAVEAMPTVQHCLGSGFALDPRHVGAADWVCSDMICYPDRLLELVRRWLELGQCRNFVCTLKFQAETDHATARAFAAIPHSRLLHLSCNKHELTWVRLVP